MYINECLNLLPEEIRLNALKNHYDYCNSETGKRIDVVHTKAGTISQAIADGFIWKESPEGFMYWSEIYHNQLNLEKTIIKKVNKNGNFSKPFN
jgi:hypothetical protein